MRNGDEGWKNGRKVEYSFSDKVTFQKLGRR